MVDRLPLRDSRPERFLVRNVLPIPGNPVHCWLPLRAQARALAEPQFAGPARKRLEWKQ